MNRKQGYYRCLAAMLLALGVGSAMADDRYNFNAEWKLAVGDVAEGQNTQLDDSGWKSVTLPYAWNQHEAYSRNCGELSDTVMWYRKHFVAPKAWDGQKVFVEFEGVRFGARVYINGKELGWGENGVMAFGFDLTPYIIYGGDNVVSLRIDSDWKYKEHVETWSEKDQKMVRSGYQWNDKNFFCNYGGINKRVWLHVKPKVYQTLPLYSNLGTTGVYVYAKDISVQSKSATIHAESQVINGTDRTQRVGYKVQLIDKDGKEVATWHGAEATIAPGDTVTLSAERVVPGLHLWSWGYGYLYTVKTSLVVDGKDTDVVMTKTGFRKTDFRDGMFYLNDRVLHIKGFAQRSTNEWPGLGISIPSWMSDYSNRTALECNANLYRWMHVTPSKQDIESFDRLGMLQAMPAGDAEKDVTDRRWQHRCEVMRDAIIYNRNNPSIIFYEGGNNQISEEHMAELKAIRDEYDPKGGRAIGSRNMLDSKVAEYGGEMLYVNTSAAKPMFMMEYNRDEGIRRYWDQWSYPYHVEGEGPLYRGAHTASYNHNQDGLAIENIVRWNEYWKARPGTGKRVNAGGAKIIFADSNTHARGEKNYRTSGVVDAMRLPKDSYFCHQVMWNGWVDTEQEGTYIIGHWNYEGIDQLLKEKQRDGGAFVVGDNPSGPPGTNPYMSDREKWVYVCSTGDEVELFLNGKSQGRGERAENFLFIFKNVKWQPGTLRAVSYKDGKEVSSYQIETVDEPVQLRMRWVDAPEVMRADGADIRIAEIEAVDRKGRRHPLAHDMVEFAVSGEGDYIGGVSGVVSDEEKARNAAATPAGEEGIISEGGHSTDANGVGSRQLMLEAGVIRVMVRSTTKAGNITLTAKPVSCDGKKSKLKGAKLSVKTTACPVRYGFYVDAKGAAIEGDWSAELTPYLERGETAQTPSYTQKYNTVEVKSFDVAVNAEQATNMTDDNEASNWSSDSKLQNSWLRANLERPALVEQIVLRVSDFRKTSYPLQVYAITDSGEQLVWEGYTPKTLGNCYLDIAKPVRAQRYLIKMVGAATVKEAFGSMTELAAKVNVSTAESKSNVLSIIEIAFNEKCK